MTNLIFSFQVSKMVFKCAAPGCRTGYDNVIPEGVSMHNFPLNVDLQKKWINAIRREEYIPGQPAKICSLHFHDSDFVQQYTDTNVTRKRSYGQQRIRRKLKDDAVPSVFPNLPSYLSSPPNIPRPTSSSSAMRMEKENVQIAENIRNLEESDVINDLNSLKQMAQLSALPGGFLLYPSKDGNRIFTKAVVTETISIVSCVIVKPDLFFITSQNGNHLDEEKYASQMQYCRKLIRFTDFLNLLAFLSSSQESSVTSPIPAIVTSLESCAQTGDLNCSAKNSNFSLNSYGYWSVKHMAGSIRKLHW